MKKDLTLPMPAATFIPHRPPMQLVDTLLSYAEGTGLVETTLGADCILVGADGTLEETALVELLAQAYAVLRGYDDLLRERPISEGYLVGVRKLQVAGRARAGEALLIRIRTVGCFEGFAVAEGEIERAGEVVASGTIKLWIVDAGAARGAA